MHGTRQDDENGNAAKSFKTSDEQMDEIEAFVTARNDAQNR
jgi:hypothetical protein